MSALRKKAAVYRNVIEPTKPTVAFLKDRVGKLDVDMLAAPVLKSERPDGSTVVAPETLRDTYPDTIELQLSVVALTAFGGALSILALPMAGRAFRSTAKQEQCDGGAYLKEDRSSRDYEDNPQARGRRFPPPAKKAATNSDGPLRSQDQ